MDFESLIWIIVVIIYVISIIAKKKRTAAKTKDTGKTEERPGWKAKLDKYLSLVRQKIDGYEAEAEGKEENGREATERIDFLYDTPESKVKEGHFHEDIELPIDEFSYEAVDKAVEEAPSVRTQQEAPEPKSPESVSGSAIRNLKEAVIWSEILAPPLALRDSRNNGP